MIAFVLRGVILVGVLGWYSSGVWKMIDIYFRDRFNKYLKEEYARNPRINPDYKSSKLSAIDNEIVIAATDSNNKLLSTEGNNIDTCSADKALDDFTREKAEVETTAAGIDNDENHSKPPGEIKSSKAEKHKKNVLLSDDNYKAARRKRVEDYDFSEFEYDDEEVKPSGIPVDELPFKPKADIGRLERVSEDEFCPILADENCYETRKWP